MGHRGLYEENRDRFSSVPLPSRVPLRDRARRRHLAHLTTGAAAGRHMWSGLGDGFMQAPFERDGGKDNGELDQRLAVLCLAWRPLRCRPNSCHARDCPCDRAISTASPTSPTPPAEARPVSAPTERRSSRLINRRKLERSTHSGRQPNALQIRARHWPQRGTDNVS